MNILNISKLQKEFTGEVLFKNISFEVNTNDKIAIIGKNGTGKSTLLKMIIGDEPIDSGEIFVNKQAKIGYLSQNVITKKSHTLYDEMLDVFSDIIRLENKIQETTKLLTDDPHNQEIVDQYARLEEAYNHQGGYEYHYQINYILTQFGFKKDDFERNISTFSGGEKTRVAFAKLLLQEPDLLILDEPTNHLDIEIINWLEDYLNKFKGALLVVTHDKYFINRVCKRIIEIDHHTIESYYGSYDKYEEEKINRYESMLKKYNRQQKEIAHLESFVERFKSNSKLATMAKDREKKLARIDRIDKPHVSKRKVHMSFSEKRATRDIIMQAKNLSIGFPDNILLENVNFNMRGYHKLAIIGPNGTGKTTLLNVLRKKMKPLSGKIEFLRHYKIGYFDQNQETLHYQKTIFEEIHDYYPMFTNYDVRSHAAKFLFFNDDLDKPISILSGGEKVRLVLLLLMLEDPDLLILDEPTNHLDIETKDIIEDVLDQFNGPVIFVSHDRYFINRISSKIIYLNNHQITEFEGDYESFQVAQNEAKEKQKKSQKKQNSVNKKEKTYSIEEIEKLIHKKEKEVNNLHLKSFKEEYYLDAEKSETLQQDIAALEIELKELEEIYFDLLEEKEQNEVKT